MKVVRFLGLAGVALAVAPQVKAAPIDGTTSIICLVNGGLNSCASVTASVAGSVLTATVTNTGGDQSYVLTDLGFFFTGTSTATALHLSPSPQNLWVDGSVELSNPGPTGGTWLGLAEATPPPIGNGLSTGESITLTFDITGSLSGSEKNIFFAFKGQSWAGPGGSFKCYEGAGGTTPEDSLCEPGSTVPEPASMALLATGLVGMGGATMLRRRRKSQG